MVKTRIAPAPTGKLHIGTARVALFNYLFAKQSGGVFVVRIEDTDRERSKKEFEVDILESLKWLGLGWDEFYRQSERISIYRKYLEKLLKQGSVFYCSHKQEETQGKAHFCSSREINQKIQDTKYKIQDTIIRFKTQKNREIEFNDVIRGRVKFSTNEIGDFSIAKSLDEPLWISAVTIDDYEMGITHVMRGEDHISNTPKQLLLQEAFGFSMPAYAHLPLILGTDRKKLSKRHGATSISEFRGEGYLAEALLNMIAFLGWNPGDEREFFTIEELVKEFSLKRVKKGGAVFNKERLDFLNQHYLKTLPLEVIVERAKPLFQSIYKERAVFDLEKLKKIVILEKDRVRTLKELVESVDFIFRLPSYNPALLQWKDQTAFDVKASLQKTFQIIEKIPKQSYTEVVLKDSLLEKEVGDRGYLLWPLRVALSGKRASAGPFEIAALLGKEEALKRITNAIQKISSH